MSEANIIKRVGAGKNEGEEEDHLTSCSIVSKASAFCCSGLSTGIIFNDKLSHPCGPTPGAVPERQQALSSGPIHQTNSKCLRGHPMRSFFFFVWDQESNQGLHAWSILPLSRVPAQSHDALLPCLQLSGYFFVPLKALTFQMFGTPDASQWSQQYLLS